MVVEEDATGELVELDVGEDENPLELFNHPYAYMPSPGPSRPRDPPGRARRRVNELRARDLGREVTTMARKDEGTREIKKGKESER